MWATFAKAIPAVHLLLVLGRRVGDGVNQVGLEPLSRFLQRTPETVLRHGVLVSGPLFLVTST
jgi:hypothetical protein